MTRKQKVDWDAVDWARNNRAIADTLGVTKSAVWRARRRLGKPTPTDRGEKADDLRRLQGLDTRHMTIPEIAHALGWTADRAWSRAKDLGMTAENGDFLARTHRGGRQRKYDWDAVDWANKYDAEIARELGCVPPQVTMARKRYGKPKGPDGRQRRHEGVCQ